MIIDNFSRWCESALTHLVKLTNRAYALVSARLRLLSVLMVFIVLSLSVSCEFYTDLGITRVGVAANGIVAESVQSGPATEFQYHESEDGGTSWRIAGRLPPYDTELGRESAETPRGIYRVDGSEIVLESADGNSKTAYSMAHLAEPHNVWVQLQKTKHLGVREITLKPGPMIYDEPSGNVVVAMGIMGVLVGDDEERWTPTDVWHYPSINFSPATKIAALLSASDFWTAALSFPVSLTALALFITALGQRNQPNPMGCLLIIAFPLIFVSILLSGSILMTLGRDYSEYTLSFNFKPLAAFVSLATSVIAVIVIALWQLRWTVYWLAILVSLTGMILLVAMPFIVWLQLGGPPDFARIAAVILCAVVTLALVAYLARTKASDTTDFRPKVDPPHRL